MKILLKMNELAFHMLFITAYNMGRLMFDRPKSFSLN